MLNIFVNILIQAKKHFVFAGVSLAMLLIIIYQLGSAILDALTSLFNMDVPIQYYGILSLLFIIGMIIILVKGDRRV